MTVLLTIHGIGLQVSPEDSPDHEGYADRLHGFLSKPEMLGDELSRDPSRDAGAVYVQSAGLARLDPEQPLRTEDRLFAHVALVYSDLEGTTPKPGSFLLVSGMALMKLRKYVKLRRLLGWLGADVAGFFQAPKTDRAVALPAGESVRAATSPSLRPRRRHLPRLPFKRRPVQRDVISRQPTSGGAAARPSYTSASSPLAEGPATLLADTLLAIENDFAAYVLRNDLRELIRGFVDDALMKLAAREDVGAIVINSHSQGTVAVFDVLTELSEVSTAKVKHLITSGSHLRKLVDLFNWGSEVGDMRPSLPWTNFYDPRDPVADALGPKRWIPGQGLGRPTSERLFRREPVTDIQVDNVGNTSAPGLRAHNYFDNVSQFVPRVATILRDVAQVPLSVGRRDSGRVTP